MSRIWPMAALAAALGCAPALREPKPVAQLGGAAVAPPSRGAAELLSQADACFARRPDAAAVRCAESLYLRAAEADPAVIEGLYGAIQAKIWLLDHEPDAGRRDVLADTAVQAGQWCERRAPESAVCAYGLALALGIQARERHATATEGLKLMVERLRRAASADPRLDHAGPARVLALVLVRAPGWPVGPGDPEAGLDESRKAVALSPDYPPNQLALAEALIANEAAAEGHEAAQHALALARRCAAAGHPDANGWIAEGEKLLAR